MSPEETATLASRVFQMISEGRLRAAIEAIETEITKSAPRDDRVAQIVEMYNRLGLPRVAKLTLPRQRALRQRLKEYPDLAWWRSYFDRVTRADLLMGRRGSGWTATFDWLMNPTNLQKVIEGNYDPRGYTAPSRAQLDEQDRAAIRMSQPVVADGTVGMRRGE